jgi:glutaredoxin-related protein
MEENITIDSSKKINIVGTNNRYMIKKVTKNKELGKKRIESNKWNHLLKQEISLDNQLKIINQLSNSNDNDNNEINKIIKQQINHKIASYRSQDVIKNLYNEDKFIKFEDILEKMMESELKCYYCKDIMIVLYDIVREMKQWTVDRIDNDNGHNKDNFYLACLECNLKRRRQSDSKFLFTKQLNLLKKG